MTRPPPRCGQRWRRCARPRPWRPCQASARSGCVSCLAGRRAGDRDDELGREGALRVGDVTERCYQVLDVVADGGVDGKVPVLADIVHPMFPIDLIGRGQRTLARSVTAAGARPSPARLRESALSRVQAGLRRGRRGLGRRFGLDQPEAACAAVSRSFALVDANAFYCS